MKLNFKPFFRGGVFLIVCVVFCFICVSGQNGVQTNSTLSTRALENPESEVSTGSRLDKDMHLTFGLDRISFLQREVPSGIPLWQYPASLIYILLAFVLSKCLDFGTRIYVKQWAERTKTKFDDLMLTLLRGPLKLISFVILLHIGLQVSNWPQWIEEILRKGLKIAVACSLTYMALELIDLFMGYWKKRSAHETDKSFHEQIFPIINKALKLCLIVVAVLVTTQNLGLNISSVIASLSIGGLALGLAAQDTLGNLFGAVAVLIDKPFRIGDRIRIDSVDGTVEAIGLRSTRIRNLDGHLITIPNKTMGSAIITNVTRRPNIKTEMNIGITYDTPTEKVKRALQILAEIYKKHPMTFDVLISFNKFNDSSLNILVVHWWNSTDQKAYLSGMEELNLMVKTRFDEERIGFAFPTQTLYVKQDSEWQVNGPSRTPQRGSSSADGKSLDLKKQPQSPELGL